MVEDEVYAIAKRVTLPNMNEKTLGMRRIQRSRDKEEIIDTLCSSKLGIFREIWRVLIFAAQVGVARSRREPFADFDPGKGIDQSTFGNCASWPGLLYLISLSETNSADCLASSGEAEGERIIAFQEYANGGLSLIREHFSQRLIDLDGLINFIEAELSPAAGEPDVDITI